MSIIDFKSIDTTAPDNVIAALERLLTWARNGEILSFAYLTVDAAGSVGHGFETDLNFKHAHQMVAGSVYLQRRLEQNALGD